MTPPCKLRECRVLDAYIAIFDQTGHDVRQAPDSPSRRCVPVRLDIENGYITGADKIFVFSKRRSDWLLPFAVV